MSRIYLVNDQYRIPGILVWLIASWVISLVAITVAGVAVWMIWGEPKHNLLEALPGFITVLLGVWGVYTGLGAMVVWIAMWIYWSVMDRSSFSARAGWFLVLLLGTYYGALIYALYLWWTGCIKAATSHSSLSSAE